MRSSFQFSNAIRRQWQFLQNLLSMLDFTPQSCLQYNKNSINLNRVVDGWEKGRADKDLSQDYRRLSSLKILISLG